jgi:hypothetical protein
MACLTIADLYQEQLDGLVTLAGTRVTYYPVVLQGYSTATQSRSPAESASVEVSGIFGEERVTAPEGAITYATTFTISSGAYPGTPSPGDRLEHSGVSYRVVELRRAWFGSVLANYVLTLGN